MANVYADYLLDMNNLNLYRLKSGFLQDYFLNDTNIQIGNYLYEDIYEVIYYSNGYFGGLFGGEGFQFDGSGNLVGGSVKGYLQTIYDINYNPFPWWGIEGFTYSAAATYSAALTQSVADDYYIISSILSGNDLFNLSAYNDSVRGYSGHDIMYGYGGNDNLSGDEGDDRLDGGTGVDIMLGGAGDDTYVVDNKGDKVYETRSVKSKLDAGGVDTVEASISYTLGSFVENLVLTGASNINGTGNNLNNIITGNSGNNVLNGGAGSDSLDGGEGNDILRGGLGNDELFGGEGNDFFRFESKLNSIANVDTILDFTVGEDIIQLENSLFKKLTKVGKLSEGFFVSGDNVIAQDKNDFILFDTSNGHLFYDPDGNGKAAMVHFATLTGVSDLSYSDLWVV